MTIPRLVLVSFALFLALASGNQVSQPRNSSRDFEIASRFAPILYQALGDRPRSDYLTRFDFDGDWRGDNNWDNLDKTEFPLKAFLYYSVSETTTHFFIHYAVFHPRDYKGGERKGALLSELIREGAKQGGKYDPTGLMDEATLAHENDMEGALVVAKKDGNTVSAASVVFVETLAHNKFNKYGAGNAGSDFRPLKVEGQHAAFYVEPKGHGIEAFTGDQKQTGKKDFLRYVFAGQAEEPSDRNTCRNLDSTPCSESVSYELISLDTLWEKAQTKESTTYGVTCDYGDVTISTSLNGSRSVETKTRVGEIGCAFLGKIGGENMARPPWGWFDQEERSHPLGSWFFDPAETVKRHFHVDQAFSTSYIRLPFWVK
jgi:hypothetical protein